MQFASVFLNLSDSFRVKAKLFMSIEVTFLLSYFSVKKSTKSHQRGLAPSSFQTTGGVHELVARSSAWQVRAA